MDEPVLSVAVAEMESVVGEESAEVVVSEQQSESDYVAVSSEGRLEVRSDACRWVEAVLSEKESALILAKTQFEEATENWRNFCLAVQRRQQQLMVGKVAGEFLLPSRSPPLYRLPYFQSLVKNLSGLGIASSRVSHISI